MNDRKTVSFYPSSDGKTHIACYVYEPLTPPRAILQISHGMCEYVERYEPFIAAMEKEGILVCGHDHLGHGKSLPEEGGLGYFSAQDAPLHLVEDLRTLRLKMAKDYPELPHFILGHSMGSFILRKYLTVYGEDLSGAVISGTSGKNPLSLPGLWLSQGLGMLKGEDYRSPLFNQIFFGSFQKPFKADGSPFAWLSRDKAVVEAYAKDPLCNFIFTLNGFQHLLEIMNEVTQPQWAQKVPTSLPLLLLSGEKDPVGAFGKGVRETYGHLAKTQRPDLTLKLYPEGRHEMLNEVNREEVYGDLLSWLNRRIPKSS